MNQQNNQEPDSQQLGIEDLTVNEAQSAAVKGGNLPKVPAYSFVIDRRPAF
jgi:hypothetical protein